MYAIDDHGESPQFFHLLMPKTRHQVIVHHARGLHVGIDDGGAHKLEPPLLEVFGKRIRFFGGGRYLVH
jgi:hypothetical protein